MGSGADRGVVKHGLVGQKFVEISIHTFLLFMID